MFPDNLQKPEEGGHEREKEALRAVCFETAWKKLLNDVTQLPKVKPATRRDKEIKKDATSFLKRYAPRFPIKWTETKLMQAAQNYAERFPSEHIPPLEIDVTDARAYFIVYIGAQTCDHLLKRKSPQGYIQFTWALKHSLPWHRSSMDAFSFNFNHITTEHLQEAIGYMNSLLGKE